MKTEVKRSALMTSTEVAEYLHVSPATLSRWRAVNAGPSWVNLGSLSQPIPRYVRADVDAWIANQKVSFR